MGRFTSGNWVVVPGKESEFQQRWTEFLEWTKESAKGFHWARLLQDSGNPLHHVSLGEWESTADVAAWKASKEFQKMLDQTRSLCKDFSAVEYEEVGAVGKN
jgi:heme-degrading monooxygenase HmoA